MDVVLAADIGGTNTRLSVYSTDGAEIAGHTIPTNQESYITARNAIVATAKDLTREHNLLSIGAGVAATIVDGIMIGSGNLPGWTGYDLQTDLQYAFDVPTVVMNDCAAAAVGEYRVRPEPFIYVIWGTGVGVAVVDSVGTVRATESGHMVINPNSSLTCTNCVTTGHLEAHVGGANMLKRFGRAPADMNIYLWHTVFDELAIGLYNLSQNDPGLPIVMGGGVAMKRLQDIGSIGTLRELTKQHAGRWLTPNIELAATQEGSGLLGAAYAARLRIGIV